MKSSARIMQGLRVRTIRFIRKNITASRVFASLSALAAVLVCVAVVIPPFPWLPELGEVGALLGTLLTAQAAITALTLAVTLFVVQGASSKRNSDDRMYREYIRRSHARLVFWSSVSAVGVTGVILFAESFLSAVPPPAFTPGLRNLILATMPAFAANLGLAVLLFERTILLTRPDNWQTLRREVNERDVREAIQIYVSRLRCPEPEGNSFGARLPYSAEGSAYEAIQSLLDDGRRAMTERRQRDFNQILDSIKCLIAHAMDEISGVNVKWSAPGMHPQWPPMRELNSSMNSFREYVIHGRDPDYLSRLRSFDYWILRESIQRRCGELFTVALANDRQSYDTASRMGDGDLLEMFRGRILLNAPFPLSDVISEEEYAYFKQLVAHQEQLLSSALHSDSPTEYQRLHEGFEEFIRVLGIHMGAKQGYQPTAVDQISRLEQDYRIALMGLGGRTTHLVESGIIADPTPYLAVVRGKHSRAESLADDIAKALIIANDDSKGFALWDRWDMEQVKSYEGYRAYPEKYPLTWFAVRLIELSTELQQGLNLHGKANQIKDWFERESEGLETYALAAPEKSEQERRELATAALKSATYADEVAEDYAIIGRDLSFGRVSAVRSAALEYATDTDYVGKFFERAGALHHMPFGVDGIPELRNLRGWISKAFLAEWPESYHTDFALLDGSRWGQAYSDNVVKILGEALKNAPHTRARLDTPQELLQAIDAASAELNPTGELMVMLVGDWHTIAIGLNHDKLDGYEPMWRVPEEKRIGDVGLHRGSPILIAFTSDERHLYVIEVPEWGHLIKAEVEPESDVVLNVNPVSAEQARNYLNRNPKLFEEQPDDLSKLRKIQTLVEIVLSHRSGFRVSDPGRARRITGL